MLTHELHRCCFVQESLFTLSRDMNGSGNLTDLPFAWAKGALDECLADVVIFPFGSYCDTILFLVAVCHLVGDEGHCSRKLCSVLGFSFKIITVTLVLDDLVWIVVSQHFVGSLAPF